MTSLTGLLEGRSLLLRSPEGCELLRPLRGAARFLCVSGGDARCCARQLLALPPATAPLSPSGDPCESRALSSSVILSGGERRGWFYHSVSPSRSRRTCVAGQRRRGKLESVLLGKAGERASRGGGSFRSGHAPVKAARSFDFARADAFPQKEAFRLASLRMTGVFLFRRGLLRDNAVFPQFPRLRRPARLIFYRRFSNLVDYSQAQSFGLLKLDTP